MTEGITICSVLADSSLDYFSRNLALTQRYNDPQEIAEWIIVDNTEHGIPGSFKEGLPANSRIIRNINQSVPAGFRIHPSIHHSSGLKLAIESVSTRFVVIIDPDFYVIKKDWVSSLKDYCSVRQCPLIASTWHPKWYTKPRYIPCCHFLFMDIEKFDIESIDFSPVNFAMYVRCEQKKEKSGLVRSISQISLFHYLFYLTVNRLTISRSKDTGYKILRALKSARVESVSYLTPSENWERDVLVKHLRHPLARSIEQLFPEKFTYIPKRADYLTGQGFEDFNLPSLATEGWEEFFWGGQPFGFHARDTMQKYRKFKNTHLLDQVLPSIINR